ncbi:aldehyde dehydrogenase (NADP(+)) [Tistrella sp.]|uniref:aldehyde dehydrogenase (NADP(+)) n=1 Tax=Tistrella sp. TaxID=2024861 RepID=UPI000C8E5059|nr:aldehyde dehydrogenase (NADP(+)) [Tistrella sp.]MAD40744.1 aldehyde dehydrogenase (NADP(+)) [Tistrella sp.]
MTSTASTVSSPGFTPRGQHLIDGAWLAGSGTFLSEPTEGAAQVFATGGRAEVDRAAAAADRAFDSYGTSTRDERARFLEAIATAIEARGPAITAIGSRETGLPAARLEGERGRTVGQLRLFAGHIRAGDYLDRRQDAALPDRAPLPRPELRMIQRPIGPVAVFGASNFPLAFSTAGGDTAAALAAGCPVIVKGHPAHPGTGEIVAEAILEAITACGIDPGVFALIQGNTHDLGAALVTHPTVRAVGFTGSLGAGRALFDLCAARPEPIPFFGELGSINPVFLLPHALAARGTELARGWAASLTMGAGQFCTNPGVVVAIDGPDADGFVALATEALTATGPQTTLTAGIGAAYARGRARIAGIAGVTTHVLGENAARQAAPGFFEVDAATWFAHPELADEVFGPAGLLVRVADADEMLRLARGLAGQLTCTLQMDAEDAGLAAALLPVLERKAGRILANGFPTGVEVADAMVHGGPYPASTNFGAPSVGTLAIRRFLRPVCYQNLPVDLLPPDAR